MRQFILLWVLLGLAASSSAQDWDVNQSHRPTFGYDEMPPGELMPLVMVYADKQVEIYIPDFTTSKSGMIERIGGYKIYGTYFIGLYMYDKNSDKTQLSTLTGNSRTGEVTFYPDGVFGKVSKYNKETTVPPRLSAVIATYLKELKTLAASKEIQDALTKLYGPNLPVVNTPPPSSSATSAPLSPEANANGVYKIGNGVQAPVLIYQADPSYSEAARKAKVSGNVQVYLIVDEQGNPINVHVVHGINKDLGLNEKAVEAVRHYRFKPAMLNGKPVKVDLYIDVNFQIF